MVEKRGAGKTNVNSPTTLQTPISCSSGYSYVVGGPRLRPSPGEGFPYLNLNISRGGSEVGMFRGCRKCGKSFVELDCHPIKEAEIIRYE